MEFEKLKKIIAEVLNVDPDEITMETTFQDDLGADSLDVYQIIMGIEEEFDILCFFHHHTLCGWVQWENAGFKVCHSFHRILPCQ